MAKYLYFDGVDDILVTPMLSFDRIEISLKFIDIPSMIGSIIDVTDGRRNLYSLTYYGSMGFVSNNSFTTDSMEVNEVSYTEFVAPTRVNNVDIAVFGSNVLRAFAEGELYYLKVYDGNTLVTHYDMSTGTVQDQSGNGNHGTLTGGTWMDDGNNNGDTENPPNVNNISKTRRKISSQDGVDRSYVTFSFDQDVTEWVVRVLGVSHDTGYIADSGGSVSANTDITAEIDWTELQQEGDNRINIYGKNADGIWTPYVDD